VRRASCPKQARGRQSFPLGPARPGPQPRATGTQEHRSTLRRTSVDAERGHDRVAACLLEGHPGGCEGEGENGTGQPVPLSKKTSENHRRFQSITTGSSPKMGQPVLSHFWPPLWGQGPAGRATGQASAAPLRCPRRESRHPRCPWVVVTRLVAAGTAGRPGAPITLGARPRVHDRWTLPAAPLLIRRPDPPTRSCYAPPHVLMVTTVFAFGVRSAAAAGVTAHG
jgi:hypothetical protein